MAMAVSNQQSRDAALLRATTELFVLEATHDPDEIRRFEELATHFLGRVSAADRAFVAERLSKSADPPGSILRMLGKDLVEIATPILRRSPALSEFDFLTIMASTGPQHHRQIATRGDLSALVVAALRLTGDAEVITRVAAYPAVMTESDALAAAAPELDFEPDDLDVEEIEINEAVESAIEPVVAAAEDVEEIEDEAPEDEALSAEALEIFAAVRAIAHSFEDETVRRAQPQHRLDADHAPMTPASFLDLDRAGRLDLLKRLGDSPSPRREGTSVVDADHAFRQALGRARLASFARQRQRDALIRTLAQGLRLPENDVTALMDDPSGEPLVVLLRGIGLSDGEAQQVLLFANPVIAQGVESFERLARLFGETRDSIAADLIATWRDGERPRAAPVHAPLFADVELRRSLRPAAAMPSAFARVQDPPERQTFGLRGR